MSKGAKSIVVLLVLILFFFFRLQPALARESRPFKLAATAVQLVPLSEESYRNGTAEFPVSSLAPQVDVITVWPEYLGIPYDIFASGPFISETHPWAVKMKALADAAKAGGRPLMLELAFVRTGMVGHAWNNNGQLTVNDGWAPVCYDFSKPEAKAIGDAYVNYAQWMAELFQPAYIVNFIEANLYFTECGGPGANWDALVDVQQRADAAIKQVLPDTPVFPSFHLETLYDYQLDGWDELQYQAIAVMAHDRFGLSIYPFGLTHEDGSFVTPYDLPADYIVRARLLHPQEQLAITETGWNNVGIAIGDDNLCLRDFPYSEEQFVVDYLDFVFASSHYGGLDIVNWWSFRDQMPADILSTCYTRDHIPFELCFGEPWCMTVNYIKDVTYQQTSELFSELVLKAFGAMGLNRNDGTPRTLLMDRWLKELSLPVQ